MMNRPGPNPDTLRPDDLLEPFTRTHLPRYLLLAVAIHVVVIGLTSWTSIYGWIDPQWQAERQAAAQAPVATAPAVVADQTTVVVTQQEPAADAAQDPPPRDPQTLTPVEQRVQEAADPSELPARPTLDIDFRDTP